MITKDLFFNLVDIWKGEHELYSIQGTVTSVDESKRTCVVTPINGADLLDVRLEADYEETTTDPKGFFVVPAVNSLVLVSFLDKNDAYISCWTSISKVVMKSDEFIFNDGTNQGIVKAVELKTQLDKTNNYASTLETATKGISVALDALVPGTSAAFDAIMATASLGDFADIQNPKVTH